MRNAEMGMQAARWAGLSGSSAEAGKGRKLGLPRASVCFLLLVLLCLPGEILAFAGQSGNAGTQPANGLAKGQAANGEQAHGTAAAKRLKKGKAADQGKQLQPVVEMPKAPEPPPPDWPANDKAELASVGWNGKDLSVAATNSSLAQILRDISMATGLKVEGLGADQRVFGKYGPADTRDVLAQLMEGSGYNILIVGDKGEGTPRELVLTAKAKTAAHPEAGNGQANQSADEDTSEEPEQPEAQPEPIQRRPLGAPIQPGQSPRTPQQMMLDLQQRQQQQQQQGPPNQAPPE